MGRQVFFGEVWWLAMKIIKRALTRKHITRELAVVVQETDERFVLGVEFAIAMTVCLSALQVANLAFLSSWNSQIFAALTGLTGEIAGLFVGFKT
jgi:hypothetical protein